jgi:hypothetical protein
LMRLVNWSTMDTSSVFSRVYSSMFVVAVPMLPQHVRNSSLTAGSGWCWACSRRSAGLLKTLVYLSSWWLLQQGQGAQPQIRCSSQCGVTVWRAALRLQGELKAPCLVWLVRHPTAFRVGELESELRMRKQLRLYTGMRPPDPLLARHVDGSQPQPVRSGRFFTWGLIMPQGQGPVPPPGPLYVLCLPP